MVITRSWDTLALIGTSEYESLITKDAVNKFLAAFVRIVAHRDAEFSSNLRKIIPLAFVSTAVIPPAAIYAPTPSIKVKKTRKVNSKPKKTRKVKTIVPPPVVAPVVPPPAISPMVAPVVPPPVVAPVPVKVKKTRKAKVVPPPVVAPVVPPPASIPKSMYVSESAPNKEVVELRKDIAACDQEVDELRKKVQDIAELTKLGPRRGGTRRNSRR
jgi:outer membrane biosynthesis protein TonB